MSRFVTQMYQFLCKRKNRYRILQYKFKILLQRTFLKYIFKSRFKNVKFHGTFFKVALDSDFVKKWQKGQKLQILRQFSVTNATKNCGNSQSNPWKSQFIHLIPLENETLPTVRFCVFRSIYIYFQK